MPKTKHEQSVEELKEDLRRWAGTMKFLTEQFEAAIGTLANCRDSPGRNGDCQNINDIANQLSIDIEVQTDKMFGFHQRAVRIAIARQKQLEQNRKRRERRIKRMVEQDV